MAELTETTKHRLELELPTRQAGIFIELLEWLVKEIDERDFGHQLADFLRSEMGWFGRMAMRVIPIEKAEDFLLRFLQGFIEERVMDGAEELRGIMKRNGIADE